MKGDDDTLNLAGGIRRDLNEGLRLRRDLNTNQRANHSRERFRGRHIDAHNLRVCVGRPHESQIQHLAQLDIICKLAPPAQQAVFFLARKRLPHPVLNAILLNQTIS